MENDKRFLVDVGLKDIVFPIKAVSKYQKDGQNTIGKISIQAKIEEEFESEWINKFIQILHKHRDIIGTATLKKNIKDYFQELNAKMVRVDFNYPYFIEKKTPASGMLNLVWYNCTYSTKMTTYMEPKTIFKIDIPVITTVPETLKMSPGSFAGQRSIVTVEIESYKEFYPETIVEIVEKKAISSFYNYLTEDDQNWLARKIQTTGKTNVALLDEIDKELKENEFISWHTLRCSNYNQLQSYSTFMTTERDVWGARSEVDTGDNDYLGL
jgi:GTP cyclohydrolase IB